MTSADISDVRGLSITAPGPAAVERLEAVIDDIYYYRLGVGDRLDALLAEHPDFTLAHVLKGYSLMSEGVNATHARAREHLAKADALPANPREALHREALRGWIAGDPAARAAAWEQLLSEWPRDLLAFRQYTGALFWMGDKRHQADVAAGVIEHWGEGVPGYGHALSAHAFAMEEVGDYAAAERSARAALDIQPQDLWAQHGLAHVFEMHGRNAEGVAALEAAAGFLNGYNLFRGHLWWHLSLFKLAQGRFDEALELFDRQIYPATSGFFLDIQNGASLLARLEFQGIDVGEERWERLAQGSLPVAAQSTVWFTSMHHVMALTRGGRDEAVRATLDYLASAGAGSGQAAVARELSQAGADFYAGRPGEALERMLAVRGRHGDLGASHAQQDLYVQVMVMAALKLGDVERVRDLLAARRATRPGRSGPALDGDEAVRAELRWAS